MLFKVLSAAVFGIFFGRSDDEHAGSHTIAFGQAALLDTAKNAGGMTAAHLSVTKPWRATPNPREVAYRTHTIMQIAILVAWIQAQLKEQHTVCWGGTLFS